MFSLYERDVSSAQGIYNVIFKHYCEPSVKVWPQLAVHGDR